MIFLVMGIYVAVRQFCQPNLKELWLELGAFTVAFSVSLLNPCGISIWTFGYKVSLYPELTDNIAEWMPGTFSPILVIGIILILFGLFIDKRVKEKNAEFYFGVVLICAFIVGYGLHVRMQSYLLISLLFFAPVAIDNVAVWFKQVMIGSEDKAEYIKQWLKNLLPKKGAFATVFVAFMFAIVYIEVIGFNSLFGKSFEDAAEQAGYDMNVIDIIKEKGYEKIYNDYTIGTWLLYYDVKVHMDNRFDPYVKAFSGETHIHPSLNITTLEELDQFYEKYHPDAIILCCPVFEDSYKSGESHPEMDNFAIFINSIKKYGGDRYKEVYCNITEYLDIPCMRWYIFECK